MKSEIPNKIIDYIQEDFLSFYDIRIKLLEEEVNGERIYQDKPGSISNLVNFPPKRRSVPRTVSAYDLFVLFVPGEDSRYIRYFDGYNDMNHGLLSDEGSPSEMEPCIETHTYDLKTIKFSIDWEFYMERGISKTELRDMIISETAMEIDEDKLEAQVLSYLKTIPLIGNWEECKEVKDKIMRNLRRGDYSIVHRY